MGRLERGTARRGLSFVRFWRWPLSWQVISLAGLLIAGLTAALAMGERRWLLPGKTSDGHRVIENACGSCHAGFASPANTACSGCHVAELEADTHPTATFEDPRWAADVARRDARRCVSCHAEHAVQPRGLSAPTTLCFECHDDVVQNRATHRELAPGSCLQGGCHNYHDNRTLDVAFIAKRLDQAPTHRHAPFSLRWRAADAPIASPDVPAHLARSDDEAIAWRWRQSAHARADVGCARCHGDEATYVQRPQPRVCGTCHEFELATFQRGKHGVRSAVGLPPLEVAEARRVMVRADEHAALGCAACHDAHALDTTRAAVDACLGCHGDDHSRAYVNSPHARHDVTCATCHLPRVEIAGAGGNSRVAVNHNNSLTLQPRDRMARMVCLDCHSLEFALSALYDDKIVLTNFAHAPIRPHRTLQMVRKVVQSDRPGPI